MISLLRNIGGFLLGLVLILFAVFNRDIVAVHYSPVNDPLSVPLYLIVLGMFASGFVIGGFAVWFNTAPQRQAGRRQRKKIKALEKELAVTKTETASSPAPPADFFPALPKYLPRR